VFFLILLLSLIFTKPVFATNPTITITMADTDPVAGTSFPVTFIVENEDVGSTFHYKFFGGIDDLKTQIQTAPNLFWQGTPWGNFPTFTTDADGKSVINTYAYIKSDSPSGTYKLFVRLNNDLTSLSYIYPINVSAAPTCTYTYTQGTCTSSGTQTLTVSSATPSGCVGTPSTSQPCTYVAPSCEYTPILHGILVPHQILRLEL